MSAVQTALVVDDDFLMREFILESLKRENINVLEAENGCRAKEILSACDVDLAFIDLKMSGVSGMDLLRFMQKSGLKTIPIIVTAFGTVERAVEAVKFGAYDFLMKPFSPEQVSMVLNRSCELIRLRSHNRYLREELGFDLPGGRRMVGKSAAVQEMYRKIKEVARTDVCVLVAGESGAGKELVSLAVHSLSDRGKGPFVRMNCAAVPDSMIDSELFGHERGAFPGALERRIGRFELADNGSLLLNEVGEMGIEVQAKLLRVLQEGEFQRVGGGAPVHVNTRVIASTNCDLKKRVAAGLFLDSLYCHLNELPIHVPSLRDRRSDIPMLLDAFVARIYKEADHPHFSEDALQLLMEYDWPGNLRELGNLVEHLCVEEEGPVYTVDMLPPSIRGEADSPAAPVFSGMGASSSPGASKTRNLKEAERELILTVLCEKDGNRGLTADDLGISVRTLRNKLNQYKDEGTLPQYLF